MKIIVTWRQGKRPKESASVPFQNSSFSTDSNARSHSIPLAKTYKSLYQLTSYHVKVIKLNKVVKNKLTITSVISNWKYFAQKIIQHVGTYNMVIMIFLFQKFCKCNRNIWGRFYILFSVDSKRVMLGFRKKNHNYDLISPITAVQWNGVNREKLES